MSKYKIVTANGKTIAISTYAGRTVKGVAKCDPRDDFDESVGIKLAEARCNLKVASKRKARAEKKVMEATQKFIDAQKYLQEMSLYKEDAMLAFNSAEKELKALEQSLS